MKLLYWTLYFVFHLFWLPFCLVLCLPGFLIPESSQPLKDPDVSEKASICWSLYCKKKLTLEEYLFETHHVAPNYRQSVFLGYQFILGPSIGLLERSDFLDPFFCHLVRKFWIQNQKLKQFRSGNSPSLSIFLIDVATSIAGALGRVFLVANPRRR